MEFINFHIAYLLTKHERVIIPDFGAFIVSKVNDDPSKRRGFISPPDKYSLSFNPEIIQDDGLLVRSIEKEKNIGYAEALRLVYEYVDSLVDNLRTGQAVQFSWIGKIQLSDERKIVFTPAKNLSCNAPNCGLVNLNFPYLNEASEEETLTEKRKKTSKRPVFYIILGTIVLIPALLFALWALKPFLPVALNALKTPDVSKTFTTDSVKLVADTLQVVKIDSVKPAIVDSTQLSPRYFIIVSSLAKEKEAEVMLNYFRAKGLNKAEIIRSDGKYRISIEAFFNKEEALSLLDMLRRNGENPLFKEAWILEGKVQ